MAEGHERAYSFGFDQQTLDRLGVAEHQDVLADIGRTCPARPVGDRAFQVLRMAEVREFNRHPDVFSVSRGIGSDTGTDEAPAEQGLGAERDLIPLNLNGEEHRRYRRMLEPLFAPQKVGIFEPAVRTLTNELIDTFIDRGEAEMYSEFCALLPATIFLSIMGIPARDLDYFLSFKNDLLRTEPGETMEATLARQADAGQRCYAYFNEILDERARRSDAGDDLIGWLMNVELEDHRLTRENILDITYLLMIAGLDTVAATLSCVLSYMARHPGQRELVLANPSLWPKVVEELLRMETPVPAGTRIAMADLEIAGQQVPAGSAIHFSWATANVDPDVFPDPLTVDFSRARIPHVAFAVGYHRCLGAHLARLELRTALHEFHRRIPHYTVAPDTELRYEILPVRLVRPLPMIWAEKP